MCSLNKIRYDSVSNLGHRLSDGARSLRDADLCLIRRLAKELKIEPTRQIQPN